MSWFQFWKHHRDEDLERELRSDFELEAAELEKNGLSAEDARYAARRAFGNAALVKEDVRRQWSGVWLEDFVKDARYTWRDLRKAPVFAVTAIGTLALGIGANTAIFTVINAVLLKSLPVANPQDLVILGPAQASGNGKGIPRDGSVSLFSYDLYKHLEGTHVFAGLCAVQSTTQTDVSIRRPEWAQSERGQATLVSGNYFDVLGVKAAVGRVIGSADDSSSAAQAAVVSFRFWKGRLGGDPSVIGSNIYVGGTSFIIIGVAPPEFYGETLRPNPPELWVPLSADRKLNGSRALIDQPDEHWLYLIGRLAPGISAPQAQSRLNAELHNWLLSYAGPGISKEGRAEIGRAHIDLRAGGSGILHMQKNFSATLRLLLGICTAVLLITCANLGHLLLARGVARNTELSIRLALGASRARLLRQSLTESLTLALSGGLLGLFAAKFGTRLVIALFFRGTDYVPVETSSDLRVLAYTLGISCAAALIFGLLPAVRTITQIAPARPGIKGSRLSIRSNRAGASLIIAEVALSLMVLAIAATFARSLANLTGQRFGFDRDRVLVINVDTAHAGYDYHRLGTLYHEMYSRLNAIPGVKSASFSSYSPFNNCCSAFSISIEGYTPKTNHDFHSMLNRVSAGYFQTLGTKLLLGRTFTERDGAGSQPVAVVTEEFVRRFMPNQNPIGKRFGIGGPRHAADLEIVGVVEDAKYDTPSEEITPMAFFPLLQDRSSDVPGSADESNFINVIEVRSDGRPESVATSVRRVLAEIDPNLPALHVRTLSQNINLMLNQENVVAALAAFFGLIALMLSCLGVYGLTAYAVQQRTSEIGLRIALGARPGSVVEMIIGKALLRGFAGVLLGVPAAFAALRLVGNQLFGVSPNDPEYSCAAALILLLCSVAAAAAPALRASRVDPLVALKYE